MDKYEIYVTDNAHKDLKGIHDYISLNLLEPNISKNIISEIDKTVLSLEIMPNRFEKVKNKYFSNRSVRKCFSNNYIILYSVNENKKTVTIIRVLYGKSNWVKLI